MKIFISWSGERSRSIAEALKLWLTDVISFFEPWVSSEDVEKGARWGLDIAHQLENTDTGVICLTPENLDAPWIHFEAGALAKAIDRSRICTYLFQVRPGELRGPLIQFQATEANERDTLKLLATLNNGLGENKRNEHQLERAFTQWWPELLKALDKIPKTILSEQNIRSDRELLEELIDLARERVKAKSPSNLQQISRWFPFVALFDDEEVRKFAEGVRLNAGLTDPNAVQWAADMNSRLTPDSLNGVWSSRWNNRNANEVWHTGVASLVSHGPYVIIMHTEPQYQYFMLAKRDNAGRLIGRHYNIESMRDTSPWVGIVVNDERIDGVWSSGRWDLRRTKGA